MESSYLISFTRLTASGIVSHKRCIFYGILVAPDGTNNSYADVYDGDNTGARKFGRYRCVSTTSKTHNMPGPVEFQFGLYVDFESNLSECTVLWRPL